MPDISMCAGFKCLKKHRCHRFTAEPSKRQSYAAFFRDALNCEDFIPNGDEAKQTPLPLTTREKND